MKKKDLGGFMFYDQDGDEWPINRTCFVRIYLKELYVDHNCGQFLENNESGLHFCQVITFKKILKNE